MTCANTMQKYKIPVLWTERATVNIEAETLDEAVDLVDKGYACLPDGRKLPDGYEVDFDILDDENFDECEV